MESCIDCSAPRRGKFRRGRCEACYRRHVRELKRSGEFIALPELAAARHPGAVVLERVNVTVTGCWHYTGFINASGYGVLDVSRKSPQIRAHRAVWEFLVAPIPAGLELDHLCHGQDADCPGGSECLHRRCVNPAHLEPVTSAENTQRGLSAPAMNARKTHCSQGHEYTPENTLWIRRKNRSRPSRRCRACRDMSRAGNSSDNP